MTQTVKFIDISQTYIPCEPNGYPVNLMDYSRAETENPRQVVAYDGYNFIPTAEGYKSYFGTDYSVDAGAIDPNIDYALMFQTSSYRNLLVALCETGIYIKEASSEGAWRQPVQHAVSDTYKPWSWCVLDSDLYVYKQGDAKLYKIPFNEAEYSAARLNDKPSTDLNMVLSGGTVTYANDKSYAYAYFKADGRLTAATDWKKPSANTPMAIYEVTIPVVAGALGYRMYMKTDAGAMYYFDMPNGVMYINTIASAPWKELTAFPDPQVLANITYEPFMPQAITPSFLNMAGQIGIFAAGVRLGFWDAENSVSWSSVDSVADFTPSLTTLAGNSVFADVIGKIVTIQQCGTGFIIYSTKSIVYVFKDDAQAYLWQPSRILEQGISYRRNVASTKTFDVQFAYTTGGIYKISQGRPEAVIPEIWDLLQRTEGPVYLDLVDNRYLMFQPLDPNFQSKVVRTRIDSVPGYQWILNDKIISGDFSDVTPFIDQPAEQVCVTWKSAEALHQNGVMNIPSPPPPEEKGLWQPFYRTHFSMGNLPAAITWATGGACPVLDANNQPLPWNPTNLLQGSNQHHTVLEDDVNDPNSRMDSVKFFTTQLAIWEKVDQARQALIQELTNKVYTGNKIHYHDVYTTPNGNYGISNGDPANRPVASGTDSQGTCFLGYIPIAYSEPVWNTNECGMSISRYCIARAKVVIQSFYGKQRKEINRLPGTEGWLAADWLVGAAPAGIKTTPRTMMEFVNAAYPAPTGYVYVRFSLTGPVSGSPLYSLSGLPPTYPCNARYFIPGEVKVLSPITHHMLVTEIEYGVFDVDTARMEVMAYKNFSRNLIYYVLTSCTFNIEPPSTYKSPPAMYQTPVDPITGQTCGQPYVPISVPAYPEPIEWPQQVVNVPGYAFLLQDGSPEPAYPIRYGAYVFDTYLKKWGRHKDMYKAYVDYSPINIAQNEPIPYEVFRVKAGIVSLAGAFEIFNDSPYRSEIVYGKIGYFRKGFTDVHEVRVHFREDAKGFVKLEPSLDGQYPEATQGISQSYDAAKQVVLFANSSARWYNVVISGKYDITYLEFRGTRAGRR